MTNAVNVHLAAVKCQPLAGTPAQSEWLPDDLDRMQTQDMNETADGCEDSCERKVESPKKDVNAVVVVSDADSPPHPGVSQRISMALFLQMASLARRHIPHLQEPARPVLALTDGDEEIAPR